MVLSIGSTFIVSAVVVALGGLKVRQRSYVGRGLREREIRKVSQGGASGQWIPGRSLWGQGRSGRVAVGRDG